MKSCLSHAIYFYNLYSFLLPTHILLLNLRTIPSTAKYIPERFSLTYSLLLKSGEIIATGTPVELIESMAGKVGEITCTLDEVGELQKE